MGPRRRARLRSTHAVLACVLWLLGVEVLPNLHLALHAHGAPHQHVAGGMVVTVTFDTAEHAHDDGTVHSHAPDAEPAHDLPAQTALEVPDLHAAGGLAHRMAALHEAPPPLVDAVPVDRVATNLVAIAIGRDSIAFVATRSARGPPTQHG